MKTVLLVTLLLFASPIYADNAVEVPAWIDGRCSGAQDVHRLTINQIHAVEGGFMFDGYKTLVPYDQVKRSQDDYVWIFYAEHPGSWQSPAFCVFVPPQVD